MTIKGIDFFEKEGDYIPLGKYFGIDVERGYINSAPNFNFSEKVYREFGMILLYSGPGERLQEMVSLAIKELMVTDNGVIEISNNPNVKCPANDSVKLNKIADYIKKYAMGAIVSMDNIIENMEKQHKGELK
jgi:hypothetical protein